MNALNERRIEAVARKKSKMGIGFPQITKIESWARLLYVAFDAMPYGVGTAFNSKEWRDVDVRMLLTNEQWERWFGVTVDRHPRRMIAPWAVLCTAISEWGRVFTGLPIDFQFQTIDEGNADPNAGRRSALGIGFYDDRVPYLTDENSAVSPITDDVAARVPLAESRTIDALCYAEMVMSAARISTATKCPNTSEQLWFAAKQAREALAEYDASVRSQPATPRKGTE